MKRAMALPLTVAVLGALCGLVRAQTAASLDDILVRLKSADQKVRSGAIELLTRGESGKWGDAELKRMIVAAGESYEAPAKFETDISEALLLAATRAPKPWMLESVKAVFPRLSKPAKGTALTFALRLKNKEGEEWFVEAFPKSVDDVKWPFSLGKGFEENIAREGLHSTILMALEHQTTAIHAASALLEGAKTEQLPQERLAKDAPRIVAAYRPWLARLQAAELAGKADVENYRWEDSYRGILDTAEYFPDLLGYCGSEAEAGLRETFETRDPRMNYFAIRSLVQMNKEVPASAVSLVATDDEMRNQLYDALQKLGKTAIFPKDYVKQEAFARSELVQWLTSGFELTRAPNDIQLMKVVSIDTHTSDGIVLVYLYRFRTTGSHWAAKDGWMAGAAGGYLLSKGPTTESTGLTFSSFKAYDAKSPEEHVAEIQKTVSEAWKRQAEREKNAAK